MTNQINQIVEHLFHKPRLDEVSVYELERFIATHPYFAAGHLLLAKKTQQSDPAQAREKVATTLLYYHNPLWLQWLLDHDINAQTQKTDAKEIDGIPTNGSDIVIEGPSSTAEDIGGGEAVVETEQNDEHTGTPVPGSPAFAEEPLTTFEENDEFITAASRIDSEDASRNESVTDQPFIEESQELSQPPAPAEVITEDSNESAGEQMAIVAEDWPEPDFEQAVNEQAQLPVHETSEELGRDELPKEVTPESAMAPDAAEPVAEDAESRATAASIGTTLSRAALIPTRAEMEKGDFTFEPYHTIDYFASQGIKLQQSDLSRDKFGKQLKSFTEWLKSMKRLPQAVAEASMDEATQQSIQRIAEHSFEEKDIVTETMAEVWIKQGNKQKAIDTLHKLSLLNPSKSHYFAAKIEQLKAS